MTKRSGFFTLPRELRDSIYRNLLVVGTINIASLPVAWLDTGEHINPERSAWRGISFVKLDDKDPMDCAMRWADSSVPLNTDYTLETYVITEDSPKPDLDVTRVCKQIFHESTEIFFTENVFCFRACWDNKDDRFPILTPATVVAAKFLEDRRCVHIKDF